MRIDRHFTAIAALFVSLAPASAQPRQCEPVAFQTAAAPASAEVMRRSAEMAVARRSGDAAARTRHYAADSVTLTDYQPRLLGPEAAGRYYRTLASRQEVRSFEQRHEELIDLGGDVFERGSFRIVYAPKSGGAERAYDGRYVHLWRRQADGAYKLKAEVWGYTSQVPDPAAYTLGEPMAPGRAAPRGDPAIGAELDAMNAWEILAVQTHDASRIGMFAEDAIFGPFAGTPKIGLPAIRAHLMPYIEQGRGATFETVKIWNEGYEVRGAYVLEYSRFEVVWRAGTAGGTVSGGGLRVWRREADCSLKRVREFGTHDHRVSA